MSELSPRRRMAGRALLGAGLLILPLTASISYAASEAARAVQEVPEPPAPPSPPEAPDAPLPPEAPEAPEAPSAPMSFVFVTTDDADAEGEDGTRKVIIRKRLGKDGEVEERDVRMVRKFEWDGKTFHLDTRGLEGMSKEDHEEMRAAIRKGLAEAERAGAESQRAIAIAIAMAEAEKGRGTVPRIMMLNTCDGNGSETTETRTDKDGKQTIVICKSRVFAEARSGLEEARAEIAADKDIPEETRKQVLETLDRQIARWKEKEG